MKYKDFVNDLELKLISVNKLSFEKFDFDKEKIDALYFRIDSEDIEIAEKSDEYLRLLSPFEFDLSDGPEENDSILFSVSVSFEIYYFISEVKEIPDGFIQKYKKDRLDYILHPYLRQVISDSLQKAGLPPLFIPPLEHKNYKDKSENINKDTK